MRTVLRDLDPALVVLGEWDNLELQTALSEPKLLNEMYQRLRCMPGIAHFLEVHDYPLVDFADTLDKCRQHFGHMLPGKIFNLRCKRAELRRDYCRRRVIRIGRLRSLSF